MDRRRREGDRTRRDEGVSHAEAWRLVPLVCAAIFLVVLLLGLAAGGLYVYHLATRPAEPPPRLTR